MERFDLYTRDRERTGMCLERGSQIPKGCYHLVVFVCLFNERGQMLIQQRQSTKKSWPDLWDVSVGGFVLAGENSREAAERETKEELGVTISLKDQAPVCSFYYEDSIHDIYCTKMPEEQKEKIRLQEEEVQAAIWADEEEVLQMIADGRFIPVIPEFIRLVFALQKKRGIMA